MGNGAMGKGQWAMGNGQWTMDNGQWTMVKVMQFNNFNNLTIQQ
jgi:hypothetical protein